MAGARRSLFIAGTLAVTFLAALVPAAAAVAGPPRLTRGLAATPDPDPDPSRPSTLEPPGSDPPSTSGQPTDPPASTGSLPPPSPPANPSEPVPGPAEPGPAATRPAPDPPPASYGTVGQTTPAPARGPAPSISASRAQIDRPAVAPVAPRANHAPIPSPTATPSSVGWADVQGGRRGPDPGSQPHPVVNGRPQAQDVGGASDGPWSFLRGPEAGAHLFVAGFVALLFSIGGLVAVGIRRHRW